MAESAVIYNLTKMDYIRSKRGRLDDYMEPGTGKQLKAKCLTHDFVCQPTEGKSTEGKAGDYIVDEGSTWYAMPHAEFYQKHYVRVE